MRDNLDHIKKIDDYLLNKLSNEEKLAFEKEIENNDTLKKEVELQKTIIDRVKVNAIKTDIKQAYKKYINTNLYSSTIVKIIIAIATIASAAGIYYSLKNEDDKVEIIEVKTEKLSFINPPIKGAEAKFIHKDVNPVEKTVLTYESGTTVIIPDSCFVDENDQIITEKVTIKFREFNSTASLLLSGIPMSFEEDGTYFESAGMSEIDATTASGKKVKMNSNKSIEIIQNSYNSSDAFNLYYFNKTTGKWEEKGKDTPADFTDIMVENIEKQLKEDNKDIPKKETIVKPKMADPSKVNFNLDFSAYEFPELSDLRNVMFEIDNKYSTFKEGEDKISWTDVKVSKSKIPGRYTVIFSNQYLKKSVKYIVYPVFDNDEDYNTSMKKYEKKIANYEKKYNKRIAKEAKVLRELKLAQQKRDSINLAIKLRNEIIEAENKITEANNKKIIKRNNDEIIATLISKRLYVLTVNNLNTSEINQLIFEVINDEIIEKNKTIINDLYKKTLKVTETNYTINQNLKRAYSINNFGIWNSDCYQRFPYVRSISSNMIVDNKKTMPTTIYLVDKNQRGFIGLNNYTELKYNPKSNNILLMVDDEKLYYSKDFDKIPETANAFDFNFTMLHDENKSVEDLISEL